MNVDVDADVDVDMDVDADGTASVARKSSKQEQNLLRAQKGTIEGGPGKNDARAVEV